MLLLLSYICNNLRLCIALIFLIKYSLYLNFKLCWIHSHMLWKFTFTLARHIYKLFCLSLNFLYTSSYPNLNYCHYHSIILGTTLDLVLVLYYLNHLFNKTNSHHFCVHLVSAFKAFSIIKSCNVKYVFHWIWGGWGIL